VTDGPSPRQREVFGGYAIFALTSTKDAFEKSGLPLWNFITNPLWPGWQGETEIPHNRRSEWKRQSARTRCSGRGRQTHPVPRNPDVLLRMASNHSRDVPLLAPCGVKIGVSVGLELPPYTSRDARLADLSLCQDHPRGLARIVAIGSCQRAGAIRSRRRPRVRCRNREFRTTRAPG